MQILKAANTVLSSRKYLFMFILLSVVIFWILILAPDRIAQSNAAPRIFGTGEYIFLGGVSILSSLVLTIQIFSFALTGRTSAGQSVLSGAGFLSAMSSAIFSSAACSLCVGTLFGFLGAGGVIFLVDNRAYAIAGSVILLLISLYFSSRRVNNDCDICHV